MQQFDEFDAVIKIRSGGKFVPRLDVMKFNGPKVKVHVAWPIEDHETSIYQGEFACVIDNIDGEPFPRSWLASGDLVRLN